MTCSICGARGNIAFRLPSTDPDKAGMICPACASAQPGSLAQVVAAGLAKMIAEEPIPVALDHFQREVMNFIAQRATIFMVRMSNRIDVVAEFELFLTRLGFEKEWFHRVAESERLIMVDRDELAAELKHVWECGHERTSLEGDEAERVRDDVTLNSFVRLVESGEKVVR